MKTKFIFILSALIIFYSIVAFSQEPHTVTIPGAIAFTWLSTGGTYGGNGGGLYIGKNTDGTIYRGYIKWNNIDTYIPFGSIVTDAVFTINWNGYQSAQVDYREFIGGTSWQEIYENIENGQIWGTRIASTTEYSFNGLTEAIQNSVNGEPNYVYIGIKNQNESNSSYYVYNTINVNLDVSYLDGNVLVTQVDEGGSHFGQVGRWLDDNWNSLEVPFDLQLPSGYDMGLKGEQNLKPGTYQKYCEWEHNFNISFINPDNFQIVVGNNLSKSKFRNSPHTVKLQNSLEGTTINYGEIEFADPWFIDSPDPRFNGTLGNRGINSIFYQRESPLDFSLPEYSYYKGVFLNQTPDPQNPEKPYYKVGMLEEQPLTVNGQERKFYPYKWTGTDVSFQDESTFESPRTGVVFTSSNATAIAVLKGQLMSNDQNAISSASQRKMVRTDNGQYHVVYESMGTVFYAYSLTSDFYGAWSPDQQLHIYGKNPSIDYDGNIVKIVFEEYNPQYGGDATIQLYTFSPQNGYSEPWDTEEVTNYSNSYYGNAKPVISYTQWEIFIAYRTGPTGGIKQRTKWIEYNWSTETDIPGTNASCINPSVTGLRLPSSIAYIFIAYENFETIYFKQAYRVADSWNFGNYATEPFNLSNRSGFNLNHFPVISLSNINSDSRYLMVSWQGIYDATPTNPLPKTDGSEPLYREAAVVKTGAIDLVLRITTWGTSSNFSNNVDYTNNGSLNTTYGSIMTWSESDGQYSKYVRRRNANGYDPITTVTPNGIHTLVSNGSEFGNVKAMSFNNLTSAPYLLNLCTTDFTYIPDGMGKITESGVVNISYGRSGIVEKNGIEFVFNIGDVLLNGETIKFIERADTLPITNIAELNLAVKSDTLDLNTESELIFSDYYYVIYGEKADSLLSNEFNVNFKCELVKLSTGEVVGIFEEINYNKTNLEEYGQQGYLVDCSGIEAGKYYLRLATTVNEEVSLSLSDIQMDNVVLEKSELNIRNFKGSTIPLEYSLEQNYPNPFNPVTTIRYQLPKDGLVTLKVYDILGAEVATLVNEEKMVGKYEVNFDASKLASGIYLYKLQANEYVSVKKMVLVK